MSQIAQSPSSRTDSRTHLPLRLCAVARIPPSVCSTLRWLAPPGRGGSSMAQTLPTDSGETAWQARLACSAVPHAAHAY